MEGPYSSSSACHFGIWLVVLALCGPAGCEQGHTGDLKLVNYASGHFPLEAPTQIAIERGLFREQLLDVELTINPDGKTSLEQLLAGDVEIASVMATPVVLESFKQNNFLIIANIDHDALHGIVTTKRQVANSPSALEGLPCRRDA